MSTTKRHRGWLLVLVLLALCLAMFVRLWRATFPGPVTNPRRFTEILQAWQAVQPAYVAHFPAVVPASASDVRLHFQQGTLQGPTTFEVTYFLPKAEFETAAVHARSLAEKTPKYAGGHYSHVLFSTDHKREHAAPTRESLTIGTANAMDRWGITLDPTRNEICYWMIDD